MKTTLKNGHRKNKNKHLCQKKHYCFYNFFTKKILIRHIKKNREKLSLRFFSFEFFVVLKSASLLELKLYINAYKDIR